MSRNAAGWGMLERTRALDYVTLQGSSTLTGCEATNLEALIMKELVDNGLDAASGGKPRIEVTFETCDGFLTLTVRDNGVGMLSSDIERIVDFSRFYSTKFHDRTPSRGALGNATKEILYARAPVPFLPGARPDRHHHLPCCHLGRRAQESILKQLHLNNPPIITVHFPSPLLFESNPIQILPRLTIRVHYEA